MEQTKKTKPFKKGQLKLTIEFLLNTTPKTRDDDFILYAWLVSLILRDNERTIPLVNAFLRHKELGLPSMHSVIRLRRKIQTEKPWLAANKVVENLRAEKEEQTRVDLFNKDYNG